MPDKIKIGYVGIGRYLPENVLTNADLEKIVDTSDEWIIKRTGIQTRRIMGQGESVSSMAISAAKSAIEHSGIDAEQISCMRVGVNSHLRFPSVAAIVQDALGIEDVSASDIAAGCSGFIFSVEDVYNRLMTEWMLYGKKSYGIAMGVDGLSMVTDWTNRSTCVLFGDGAGAVVIGPVEAGEILATHTKTEGKYANLLELDEFLSVPLEDTKKMTFRHRNNTNYPFLTMAGPKVFAVAVRSMVSEVRTVIKKYNQANGANITESDIDYVFPHQANLRIVSAVRDALKLTPDRIFSDGVKKYGNTSAASIPIGYVDQRGKRPGALEVDVSFGSGFASGAILRRVAP